MILATEDPLSETVLRRISAQFRPEVAVCSAMGGGGRSKLELRARSLNRTARSVPVFMLLDLDRPIPCIPEFIRDMFGSEPAAQMLFRFAVMEVESWLLADRATLARFLSIAVSRMPRRTDELPDPKRTLIDLARGSSSRSIREDLVPPIGSTASQGPVYSQRMIEFAANAWRPESARLESPSLDRAITRLVAAYGGGGPARTAGERTTVGP